MPLARIMLENQLGPDSYELVFIDDGDRGSRVNGQSVLGYSEFLSTPACARAVCIAIADPETRFRLFRQCLSDNVRSLSVSAANTVVMDDVQIGEGAILSPFVTLTSNIRIGKCFHANLYSYVEHDCVIGDFVTFAPAVRCNGNVVIEDHAYLGSGCILRQGQPGEPLVIGRGAVVGMGAVVTCSVPPGATVAGNPARPIVKD